MQKKGENKNNDNNVCLGIEYNNAVTQASLDEFGVFLLLKVSLSVNKESK